MVVTINVAFSSSGMQKPKPIAWYQREEDFTNTHTHRHTHIHTLVVCLPFIYLD